MQRFAYPVTGVVRRQGPDGVQMVGQHDQSVQPKRPPIQTIPKGRAQVFLGDVVTQDRRPPFSYHREEKRPARNLRPPIIRHSAPSSPMRGTHPETSVPGIPACHARIAARHSQAPPNSPVVIVGCASRTIQFSGNRQRIVPAKARIRYAVRTLPGLAVLQPTHTPRHICAFVRRESSDGLFA